MRDIPMVYVLSMEEALSFRPREGFGMIYLYDLLGKQYIGQTSGQLKLRHRSHMCGNTYFDKHLKTHRDGFVLRIIDICPCSELDLKERMRIEELGTLTPNGWNYETGGNANKHLCEELKESNGRKISQAHKDGRYQEKYKVQSDVMKRLHASGKHTCTRRIVCLETEEIFDTVKEASDKTGIHVNRIHCALRECDGRTAGGYHWADYELWCKSSSESLIEDIESRRRPPARKVVRVEDGRVFNSIKEASEDSGIGWHNIERCILGKYKTAGGYHWTLYKE